MHIPHYSTASAASAAGSSWNNPYFLIFGKAGWTPNARHLVYVSIYLSSTVVSDAISYAGSLSHAERFWNLIKGHRHRFDGREDVHLSPDNDLEWDWLVRHLDWSWSKVIFWSIDDWLMWGGYICLKNKLVWVDGLLWIDEVQLQFGGSVQYIMFGNGLKSCSETCYAVHRSSGKRKDGLIPRYCGCLHPQMLMVDVLEYLRLQVFKRVAAILLNGTSWTRNDRGSIWAQPYDRHATRHDGDFEP